MAIMLYETLDDFLMLNLLIQIIINIHQFNQF